jgi:hypothetical protein
VSTGTVSRGLHELGDGAPVLGRVRRVGGGRKPITQTALLARAALLALVELDINVERHGARTPAGVIVRIFINILALTTAIWHNDHTGQPIKRSLTLYDH